MDIVADLLSRVRDYIPFLLVTLIVILLLRFSHQLLIARQSRLGAESSLPRQIILLILTAIGLVITILAFPMSDSTRGQVLSLLGIVLTGVIAFSSTTFVANAMAGLMLRVVKTFKPGDFIQVNEQWGRVTERGLFHTEIQTEDRDLTTFPNLYLVTHPFTVVRKSGTIISTSLSLGYDVPRRQVEELLLQAALETELQDPFVHISHLGDFAITYKVSGFLAEVKQLLTVKSQLRKKVVDVLHQARIEIVSPAFMNQRQLQAAEKQIPKGSAEPASEPDTAIAEDIVFDKAEQMEQLEQLRSLRNDLNDKLKRLADEDIDDRTAKHREELQRELEHLDRQIDGLVSETTDDSKVGNNG